MCLVYLPKSKTKDPNIIKRQPPQNEQLKSVQSED